MMKCMFVCYDDIDDNDELVMMMPTRFDNGVAFFVFVCCPFIKRIHINQSKAQMPRIPFLLLVRQWFTLYFVTLILCQLSEEDENKGNRLQLNIWVIFIRSAEGKTPFN